MNKCLYFVVFSVAVSMTALAAPQKTKSSFGAEIVEFKNGDVTLHGLLYKPKGKGPFPAVIFNLKMITIFLRVEFYLRK